MTTLKTHTDKINKGNKIKNTEIKKWEYISDLFWGADASTTIF